MLNEDNNRFSKEYAPVMNRLLSGDCTSKDVDYLNTRVLGGKNLGVRDCWDAKFITFRNKVSQALTLPTMRTLCQALDTPLFLSTACDVLVGDERAGRKKVFDPEQAWPCGLHDGVRQLDDSKTNNLSRVSCLAIGTPVVLSKQPQYVLLGVTNNADAVVVDIELDPREPYLQNMATGYRVVELQFPPTRVLIYIEAADKAGLKLEGLPRGVIGCCSVERNFSIVGSHKRKFTFSRTQIPLSVGILSSVYRAQGETIAKLVLDLRKPVDGNMDSAAVYVALSRATDASRLFLLSPVSLDDLTHPQDADVAAQIAYLERLDEATLALFLEDPSTFRPAKARPSTTLESGTNSRGTTTGAYAVPFLPPNSNNNCLFNAAMAAALAAWDGHPLPYPTLSTPAGVVFFTALAAVRDSMFDGAPLLSVLLNSLARARDAIVAHSGLPGTGSQMGTPGAVFEAAAKRADDHFHPDSGWTVDLEDRHTRVVYAREALGLNWRYSTECPVDDHQHVEITGDQSGRWRDPATVLIPHGPPQSLQDTVNDFFFTGAGRDFSFPGPAPYPASDGNCTSSSLWSILPWSADNAPDRLFIASSRVDADDDAGEPPAPSTTLVLGIDYSLVAVVYSIPNHFVTQFLCKGRWFKYDCVQGGVTTACSAGFDSGWHHGYQHMFVYLQKSMMLPVP
ncbi:unnamed protein product, partial [Laminaria digitata]